MQLHEILRDRKTETRSAKRAMRRAFALAESFEDVFSQVVRNYGAGILNGDYSLTIRLRKAAVHPSAARNEFECVRQEVQHDAFDLLSVDLRSKPRRRVCSVRHLALPSEGFKLSRDQPDNRGQVYLRIFRRHFAGI